MATARASYCGWQLHQETKRHQRRRTLNRDVFPVHLQRFQETDERLLGVLHCGLVGFPPRMTTRQRREVREVPVVVAVDLQRVGQCPLFHTQIVYHTSCKSIAPHLTPPSQRGPLPTRASIATAPFCCCITCWTRTQRPAL